MSKMIKENNTFNSYVSFGKIRVPWCRSV